MGRVIASRLVIEGTLEALTPLHVGGYGNSPDTDLPIAQNGRGEWYVPGTSLAGVIRAWGLRFFTNPQVTNELFGPLMKKGDDDSGHASFFIVEDATIINSSETVVEIRDGVGIDRRHGTAADRVKYDRAILPRGTKLKLRMIVELKNGKKRAHSLFVKHLVKEFSEAKLEFGAATTRGLGRMKLLDNVRIREDDFSTRAGFLRMLQENGEERTKDAFSTRCDAIQVEQGEDEITFGTEKLVRICINWKPRRSLMVKAGFDGNGVDMLPLTSGNEGNISLVLPGSSIKGVLRSHSERILRTLFEKNAPESFLEQLESVPLVNAVFGRRNRSDQENDAGSMIGGLKIRDCYSTRTINPHDWDRVISATANPDLSSSAQELHQSIATISPNPPSSFSISHHVAIDRWTGGAAEGALFSVLEPINDFYEPIEMSLDLGRLEGKDGGTEMTALAVVLLLFLLRDMASRRIPFGFGTNRGLGEIEITGIGIEVADTIPELIRDALRGVSIEVVGETNSRVLKFDSEKIRAVGDQWKEWVERNRPTQDEEQNG